MPQEEVKSTIKQDQWRNRRRMAWWAFSSVLLLISVLVIGALTGKFDVGIIAALAVPIGGYLTWSGAIVINYISAATYSDIKSGDK